MKLHIPISSWAKFEKRMRKRDNQLLEKLDDFPDAILVAGCQRSGTTAITNILREAVGMPPFSITHDDELDGALILCGHASSSFQGRCCFQTTYLNERVTEYSKHDDFKLTWVIRNPHAVVSSMLYHWRRGALRRLFHGCGSLALDQDEYGRYKKFGSLPFSRLRMACLSYNIKTAQIHYLASVLPPERLLIVDYDKLLADKLDNLSRIFGFFDLPFRNEYLDRLRKPRRSLSTSLSEANWQIITNNCESEYEKARQLAG